MPKTRKIWCCCCQKEVTARLTNGKEVYSHRPDLADLPFWKCPNCGNFVGCHHKSEVSDYPLGVIPTPEIKKARREIHKILDPLWQNKRIKRGELYRRLAEHLGKEDYHTAEIRSIEEARDVWRAIVAIEKDLKNAS